MHISKSEIWVKMGDYCEIGSFSIFTYKSAEMAITLAQMLSEGQSMSIAKDI